VRSNAHIDNSLTNPVIDNSGVLDTFAAEIAMQFNRNPGLCRTAQPRTAQPETGLIGAKLMAVFND
jgi:hypothetical protein